ncbi:hypothetical protein [Brevundimonas aurifodinae]|uniref:Lysine transporter LysE n=1 Tax=Brevundimonas aurifodinae TaxID=1508312 RepID=A0ABV1NL22_9CAUL
MSAFEFFFSFYGLILGLSVAEIITGFARALRTRQSLRVGWLTPLLALFVLMDLASFWAGAWLLLQSIQITYAFLIAGLTIAAVYYLSASLVIPDDFAAWPSFDDYFDRHKSQVMLGVVTANTLAFQILPLLSGQSFQARLEIWSRPDYALTIGLYYLLAAAVILVRHRRANMALLSILIGLYGLQLFAA